MYNNQSLHRTLILFTLVNESIEATDLLYLLTPGGHQVTLSLPSWTGEEKYNKQLMGQDNNKKREHSAITIMRKTGMTWGNKIIKNQEYDNYK